MSRVNIVYSTDPDYAPEPEETVATLPPEQQKLRIWKMRKAGNKTITVIRDFQGNVKDLSDLSRRLKRHCSVGGTVKDGEIILQGDVRDKALGFLHKAGYKAVKSGG